MPNRRVAGKSARSYDIEGLGDAGPFERELGPRDSLRSWRWCGAVESRTILIAEANAAIAPVHGRVSAILRSAENDGWLEGEAATAPRPAERCTLEPAAALSRATAAARAKVLATVGNGGLPDDP